MSKTVSFSFDSEEQKNDFEAYAKERGMSLSVFAKWSCFTVRSKNRAGVHLSGRKRGAVVRRAIGLKISGGTDG